jgi:hypothetical protein
MVDGEGVLGVPSVAPVNSFHHPHPVFILKATPYRRTNAKAWKPSRKKFDAVSKIGELKKTVLFLNVILREIIKSNSEPCLFFPTDN